MLLPSLKEEKLGLNGSDVSASLFSAKFFFVGKSAASWRCWQNPGKQDREMTKGGIVD